jgi:UrcA family protein
MTNLTSRISGLAMLALAALPMAALATGAHAAPVAVKTADLNLFSAEGVATFQQRADAATGAFCREVRGVAAHQACRAGVKAEIADKFAMIRSARTAALSNTFAAR